MTTNTTNFSYPKYSEDHPKFGINARKASQDASTLQQPEPALTKESVKDGPDQDWASQLSAAYLAKRAVREGSSAGLEFKSRRADSQATLVDFTRRPSRTNTGKFRLEVAPNEATTSHSGNKSISPKIGGVSPKLDQHLKDAPFGGVQWRPSLNPLQRAYQGNNQRLDSNATLVDWERRASRDSFRGRLGSDANVPLASRSRAKSRQGSSFGIWTPSLPDLEDIPQTPSPEPEDREPGVVQLEKPIQFDEPFQLIDPFLDVERNLKGGVRPPSVSDETQQENLIDVLEKPIIRVEPTQSTHQKDAEPIMQDAVITKTYPVIADPIDPARKLTRNDLIGQRVAFSSGVMCVNVALVIVALLAPARASGIWVLAFILFIKSKDCISALMGLTSIIVAAIYRPFRRLPPIESKWIMSLIPAYSESEEQIVKTVFSLRDNGTAPHKQLMCIVLDGKPRNVKQHMRITRSFRREYVTSKFTRNELIINAGFMEDVPVICFEKVKNAGKKDSLILCHDLFNVMRDNAPLYTKLLRKEIEEDVLPSLVGGDFPGFDMVFCTDADSTIHKGAIAGLANAIARDPKCIASCGLVLVELEPGAEWSFWNLYQQFQYTFGQFVRRQAESIWGKVTCLPGCITMIAVRPEMAGAMRKYAEPITVYPVLMHQIQYLGTDRRLTYSMLSQSKDLHTIFVPSAVSETVAPQSFKHYVSQRRRWGSNAYFNDYLYFAGEQMIFITRLCAVIELTRLTLVYYRVFNTALFIYGLTQRFSAIKLVPLIIVSQIPTCWYLVNMCINPHLRAKAHKLLIGLMINKFMGPVMSLTIFTNVIKNLGSQAWGLTGGSNATAAPTAAVAQTDIPGSPREDSIESIVAEEAGVGLITTPEILGAEEFDDEDASGKIIAQLNAGL